MSSRSPVAIGLWCAFLGFLGCGPAPAKTVTASSLVVLAGSTPDRVKLQTVVVGDGALVPFVAVEVRRDSRLVTSLADRPSTNTVTFTMDVELASLLEPTDTAPSGGTAEVTLELRVVGEGFSDSSTHRVRLGCGDRAVCAGRCTDLSSDALNCGQCSNACVVQVSTGPYEGRCLNSACNWPGVTVSSPSSCASVCASLQFKGAALSCVPRCSYTATGEINSAQDTYVGAVVIGNTAASIASCAALPQVSNFSRQLCCCG